MTGDDWDRLRKELDKGRPVADLLSELGLFTEEHLKNVLELRYGIPYVSLKDLEVSPECLELLPNEVINELRMIPIELRGERVTIAMTRPNDASALEQISKLLPDYAVNRVVCADHEFDKAMERLKT